MVNIPFLRLGEPIRHGQLTVIPFFLQSTPTPPGYLLASDAMAEGLARVEEIGNTGSVPELAVEITATEPVLFLEGEELKGAKQNRVLNTTVLVAGKSKIKIPVSCVEQGRWRYTSRHFGNSGSQASPKLRKLLKMTTEESLKAGLGHTANQGQVWEEVKRMLDKFKTATKTMAMSDCYESLKPTIDQYQMALDYPEGAVGLAAIVGNKVVSVDLFDHPATCRKVWSKLLSGLVIEAEESEDAGQADVEGALETLKNLKWEEVPAVALGNEYRSKSADGIWHASALTWNGRVIHSSLIAS
jgi:hypothetical protein